MNKKLVVGRRKHYDYGKDHPGWKGGKPKCIDCGKQLSCYGYIRCTKCYGISKRGKNLPHCIDCGIELKDYTSKRCRHHAKIYQYKTKPETKTMLGKKQTKITKNKISNTLIKNGINKGRKNGMFGIPSPHGKRIKYKGISFRSGWEVAYAKYLDRNNIKWFYESKTFDLGNCTYTPDFYLPKTNKFIEIKGFWRDRSKLRFNLFRKKYFNIKITILMEKDLKNLKII
jgi:hypothetical protein